MCEFPSWIKDAQGKEHWLTDKDVTKAIREGVLAAPNDDPWKNATGHSAIEKVLGVKGTHMEGKEGIPSGFKLDISRGACNKMAQVEPVEALKNVGDLLPDNLLLFGEKYSDSLDLSGCDLKGIKLPTSVGGYLYLSGAKLDGEEVGNLTLKQLCKLVEGK